MGWASALVPKTQDSSNRPLISYIVIWNWGCKLKGGIQWSPWWRCWIHTGCLGWALKMPKKNQILEILKSWTIWKSDGAHTHGSHLPSLGPPRLNCSTKSLLFLVHCSWHWILRFHITAGQNNSSPLSAALIRFAVCSVLLLREDFTTGMREDCHWPMAMVMVKIMVSP